MRGARILVIVLLAASACRGESPPQALAPQTPKPTVLSTCPLTGEKAPPGLASGRPAVAIKIDNAVRARPQAGLDQADIVYEELAEGGITRFLAVFHCHEAAKVGPVRSARLVDPDILREYSPVLLGYSGANKDVLKKVRSTAGVVDLQYATNGKAYQKVRGRPAPHDIFTGTATLRSLSGVSGSPKSGLDFKEISSSPSPRNGGKSPTASPSAEPVGSAVSFSFAGSVSTRYALDPASGDYLRSVGGKAFLLENGSQVRAKNVVFLRVKISDGEIRDAAGNFSPEISVTGSGEAIVLAAGRATKAKWVRPSLSDPTRLINGSGAGVFLRPGTTWIHLVPSDRPITLE